MTRLIVLGASARAAAFSAARAGYEPYAIDQFADSDLRALCPAVRIDNYPRDFLRLLAAAPQAPWLYTGGLENYPRLVDRLAGLRPLWGNAGTALRGVRDPVRLADVLREAGLAFPALAEPATPFFPGAWLVKPLRSSAGLGVRFATQDDLPRPPRGSFVQQYIDGQCGSATFVAAGGKAVLLGATRQIVGRDWQLKPEFLYVGSFAPLVLSASEQEILLRMGNVLASQFGLVGLFGIDFVRTPDQLWALEVNPRYSASIEVLERVADCSFIALHAAACIAGELPSAAPPPTAPAAGKAVVYAREDARVAVDLGAMEQGWSVADIPAVGETIRAGHPVATVFAQGGSLGEVEQSLRECDIRVRSGLIPLNT